MSIQLVAYFAECSFLHKLFITPERTTRFSFWIKTACSWLRKTKGSQRDKAWCWKRKKKNRNGMQKNKHEETMNRSFCSQVLSSARGSRHKMQYPQRMFGLSNPLTPQPLPCIHGTKVDKCAKFCQKTLHRYHVTLYNILIKNSSILLTLD